jgi:hypothetical protein
LCGGSDRGTLAAMNAHRQGRLPGFFALVAFAAVAMGCGPHWVVIQQAVPDPFVNQRQFFIEPLHEDRFMVGDKPEPQYLAEKSREQQDSWQADKADMVGAYGEGLIAEGDTLLFPTQPGPTTFIVRAIVEIVEPGFYAVVAGHATELDLRVEILSPSGQLLDAIAVHSMIPASMTNAASGTRMRQAANDAGHTTAEYLKTRVSP